jgi:hypothetical protein
VAEHEEGRARRSFIGSAGRESGGDEGNWSSSVMAMMAISRDSRCTETGF